MKNHKLPSRGCSRLLLLLAVGILAAAAAAPAQATYPGRPGPIVYGQSTTTVNAENQVEFHGGLYAHGPRKSQRPQQLTSERDDRTPAYSADGRWIVFAANRGGAGSSSHIYVMRSDGSGIRQLTTGVHDDANPYFSPDGRRVAFDRSTGYGGVPHIFVVGVDGGGVRQLTHGPNDGREPVFTPSGKRIVFVSSRDAKSRRDHSDIWAMGSNGAKERVLIEAPGTESAPDVAPSGRRIVFVSTRQGSPNLFVARSDGSRPRQLTKRTGDCSPCYASPAWSPDGRHIAALLSNRGNSSIAVMRADGRRATRFAYGALEEEGYGTTLGTVTWGPAPGGA
jgi:Tol biopolymer transport system component